MNSTELIITSKGDAYRFAFLINGLLYELLEEPIKKESVSVGEIYLGKVKRIKKELNAAFVDIGSDKEGFLHYLDLGLHFNQSKEFVQAVTSGKQKSPKLKEQTKKETLPKDGQITDYLKPGNYIMVQVAKEAISSKGPRLSADISLAGRNMVLMPFDEGVSISKNIEDETERKRLKTLVQSMKPEGFGAIIRTAAENKHASDIHNDIQQLSQRWNQLFKQLQKNKAPLLLLSEANRAEAVLRDKLNEEFTAIHCDDISLCEEMREYVEKVMPGAEKIVKHYSGSLPIFEHFGIERQIKQSFGKTVTIPNGKGAYLVIEHTEALHVIDVNSGSTNFKTDNQADLVLQVNLSAAQEIARQLRLRDMGGIIVVDFIDMPNLESRKKLYEKLKEAMASDKAKHKILPPTKFGLVQITRQRVRQEKTLKTHEEEISGKAKKAPITVINDIEEWLKTQGGKSKRLILRVHPFVAAYLTKGWFSIAFKWRRKYGSKLKVLPMDSFKIMEFAILDKEGKELYHEGN